MRQNFDKSYDMRGQVRAPCDSLNYANGAGFLADRFFRKNDILQCSRAMRRALASGTILSVMNVTQRAYARPELSFEVFGV